MNSRHTMKNFGTLPILITLLTSLTLLSASGQISGPSHVRPSLPTPQPLPTDLQPIARTDVPKTANAFYSMANYNGWYPPAPAPWPEDADMYFSPSIGTDTIFVDDRAVVALDLLTGGTNANSNPMDGPILNGNGPIPTDCLWLTITNVAAGVAHLGLFNTVSRVPYEILSSESVTNALRNWNSEGIWVAPGTNTPVEIAVGTRTNDLFFRARVWTTNFGFPTNSGQIMVLLSSISPFNPIINGVTNTIYPFYGNWAMLNPPLYAVNFGYNTNDDGILDNIVFPHSPQGILQLLGVSKTITNLCLSFNPLSTLDLGGGWMALMDVEAWHCTNMLNVNVKNCPQLNRACFEAFQGDTAHGITNALDFTGCPKIEQVRAADNRMTDVTFDPAVGAPALWHFCIHDNTVNHFPPNMDFSQYPSLRELWNWADGFQGQLVLTPAQCTNLMSVDAWANAWTSADFRGQTNLQRIRIHANSSLTNIDVSGCSNLRWIVAENCHLSTNAVDSILIALDVGNLPGGMYDYNGMSCGFRLQTDLNHIPPYPYTNAAPSPRGMNSYSNLMARGWNNDPDHWITWPDPAMPHISGVAISSLDYTSAIISWSTDSSCDSTIIYTPPGLAPVTVHDAALVTTHAITLNTLTTNTTYTFYAVSTDPQGRISTTEGNHQMVNHFTTLGAPRNTKPIWFINSSASVSMHVVVDSGATVTWFWGSDNSTSSGTNFTKNLGGSYSNAVVVDPPGALTAFGLNCGSNTTLSAVGGLTNYPNLQELHLYMSGLSSLSLAGCSNLVSIALVGTSPSTNVENAWFNDLAAAEPTMPPGTLRFSCNNQLHTFYFPINPGTNATSAWGCSNLYTAS